MRAVSIGVATLSSHSIFHLRIQHFALRDIIGTYWQNYFWIIVHNNNNHVVLRKIMVNNVLLLSHIAYPRIHLFYFCLTFNIQDFENWYRINRWLIVVYSSHILLLLTIRKHACFYHQFVPEYLKYLKYLKYLTWSLT